jgi:hypothetical protein
MHLLLPRPTTANWANTATCNLCHELLRHVQTCQDWLQTHPTQWTTTTISIRILFDETMYITIFSCRTLTFNSEYPFGQQCPIVYLQDFSHILKQTSTDHSVLMHVQLSTNITLPSTANFSDMQYKTRIQNFVSHCIYIMVVLHNPWQTQTPSQKSIHKTKDDIQLNHASRLIMSAPCYLYQW